MRPVLLAILCSGLLAGSALQVRANEIPEKYRATVRKGLEWLAKQQRRDGHWAGTDGQYPVSMTALAGMALLAEGSTIREGKYAEHTKRAVAWLMDRSQKGKRDGLIGNPDNPDEAVRYMYGHGHALAFLAAVYGDADDRALRDRLKDVLTRAVQYTVKAQSTQGGWFYTSAAEGHDSDEASVTVALIEGLRAARNAGIAVPRAILDKGLAYLKEAAAPVGGRVWSTGRDSALAKSRPSLAAAALVCFFAAGDKKSDLVKKWLKYCNVSIPLRFSDRVGHDAYTHSYYAKVVYELGDHGWVKLFPDAPKEEWVTWSKYRELVFGHLMRTQNADGSWPAPPFSIGPVYMAAVNLSIMQLENTVLPLSR